MKSLHWCRHCRNVGALLDVIAVDVRNRLANKHSMRAPFVPGNLVKLLCGYARTQHISSASSSMLDAAAGSVVRRMTSGHLNAVTKVSDLSQLLQAYASMGHKSTVVMPELLNAASNQVRLLHLEGVLLLVTMPCLLQHLPSIVIRIAGDHKWAPIDCSCGEL